MKTTSSSQPRILHLAVLLPARRIAIGYLTALIIAEALTVLVAPLAGMTLHGVIFAVLVAYSTLITQGRVQRWLLALTLAPLIRLVSLFAPLWHFPLYAWYLIVGLPLFLAAFLAARQTRLNRRMLGLTLHLWPVQLLVGLAGVGLGYIEYQILRPGPLVTELRWEQLWLPALVLLLFTGLLEEVIFRGLMQYTSLLSLGRFGLLYVPAVFAALHLGYRSALDLLFVFATALSFGWIVQRTGSILGVSISHGLANISLYLVFPFLLAGQTPVDPSPVIHSTVQPPAGTTPQPAARRTAAPATLPAPADILAPVDIVTPQVSVLHIPLISSAGESPVAATQPAVEGTPQVPESPTPTGIAAGAPTQTDRPTQTTITPDVVQPEPECGPPPGWVVYIVRPRDSLSALSRAVGTSLAELQRANCLENPNRIYAGQRLYLPKLPPVIPTAIRTYAVTSTPFPTQVPASPTASPTLPPPTDIPATDTPAPQTETPVPTELPTPLLPTDAPTEIPTEIPTQGVTEPTPAGTLPPQETSVVSPESLTQTQSDKPPP